MFTHVSPHRMAVPPPYPTHHEPAALAFVSKIVLGAIAVALGAAVIVTAPPTVLVPIASVLAVGAVVSLVVVSADRWISQRRASRAVARWTQVSSLDVNGEKLRPREAAGLIGFLLLLPAVIAPAKLRLFLTSAGLFGVAGSRVAAARDGWARRGGRWSDDHPAAR